MSRLQLAAELTTIFSPGFQSLPSPTWTHALKMSRRYAEALSRANYRIQYPRLPWRGSRPQQKATIEPKTAKSCHRKGQPGKRGKGKGKGQQKQ